MGQKLRSGVLNKFDDVQSAVASDVAPRDQDWTERIGMARATVESLGKLSRYMTGVQGRRKSVLFISEGLDFDIDDQVGVSRLVSPNDPYALATNTQLEATDAAAVNREMQATLEAATRGNVAVYAIDPRGLADVVGRADHDPGQGSRLDRHQRRGPDESDHRRAAAFAGELRTLSTQTGATPIVGTNNFGDGFGRIVQDNSTYYMLGYHAQPKNDGKFHDIAVKVTRPGRPGARAQGLLRAQDRPLEVARGAAGRSVARSAAQSDGAEGPDDARDRRCREGHCAAGHRPDRRRDRRRRARLHRKERHVREQSRMVVHRARRRPAPPKSNGRKTADFALTPKNKDAVAEHGLRFATEIELPPGRYQFRVAGKEGVGGRAGSVFWDVDRAGLHRLGR